MVDNEKDIKDDEKESEAELDLSFKGKGKASKINILGYETDMFGLIGLGLAALATAGTGYLLYDHINKNKAVDEQKKYEQWIAQQQALQNQQMVQPASPPKGPITEPDMVDMNTVNTTPTVNYDRFLDNRGTLSPPQNYQVNSQPLRVDSSQEAVIDMDRYSNAVSPELEELPVEPQQRKKQQENTADELMAAMNNYDYGSS